MPSLFDPIAFGEIKLPNRLVMAPLTRARASEGRVPNDLMADYYRQRAGAGLILTEATSINPMGVGYENTPGIWSEAQVEGWKKITKAVHGAGGRIVMQLWHVGRISDPSLLGGELPVAPSAVAAAGHVSLLRPMRNYVTPRALELSEIKQTIEDYRRGAENAKRAGFDGVEIHGANGYLPDQFLQSKTNLRTDEYGGSLEKRARFLLEVTDAAISVWGAGRVGVHIAPRSDSHDIGDEDGEKTFAYVARELGRRKIAFLFARARQGDDQLGRRLKEQFGGPFIANQELDLKTAEGVIARGEADAVSFGQLYIANPDLDRRLREKLPLNEPDKNTFYAPGATGYTDYPAFTK